MKLFRHLALALIMLGVSFSSVRAQSNSAKSSTLKITKLTLENGLTVFLNEDHTKPLVFGGVCTKAGSKNDPADHTGIAHYLEHMLFKGTQEMGTTDYAAEKVHLDSIYTLYETLGKTTDEVKRKEIQKLVNEQSLKAGEYAVPTEIDKLIKSIGGTGMNAFTGEEITFFHNAFPPSQINKWLELYSHRFENPVFRLFQSELEVVYEEKNISMDNFVGPLIETFLKNLYKKHPYGQQTTIGTIEHLKNPSLKAMYDFYKTYYVANNMALVLCGDFDTEAIIPIIKEKFGVWKKGEVPKYPEYKEVPFNGREVVNVKLSPVKLGIIGYRTVPNGDNDEVALAVANNILSNAGQTGLLDKLVLDSKLLAAQYIPLGQNNDYGSAVFLFVPKILGQSLENAEGLIQQQFEKLRKGEFSDTLLEGVKKDIYKEFETSLEKLDDRTVLLAQAFTQNRDINEYLNYSKKVIAVTKEDVIKVAGKYYNKNYLVLLSKMGFPKKQKIEKPGYDPIAPKKDAISPFAKKFNEMKTGTPTENFVDFSEDAKIATVSKGATLYYVKNPLNDIYTLKIKFGIGTIKNPELAYASELMNYASIKGKTLDQTKSAFQKIGCTYSFSCDDNYVTAELIGLESDLKPGLELLKDLMLAPQSDDSKIKNLIQGAQSERKFENADPSGVAKALVQYIRKGDKSSFINRLSMKQIKALKSDSLLALFKQATQYEAQIHYVGNKYDFATLQDILKTTLKFSDSFIPSESPMVIDDKTYEANTVYFVNRKDAIQSQIYFYVGGEEYTNEKEPYIDAFNDYFGGGFSGLVIQEIREYRSMAYSAGARYSIPALTGKRSGFIGYIGTQADKTIDAIKVFEDLLTDLPQKTDRIENIRSSLVQEAFASKPDFRDLSEMLVSWKYQGYYEDPAKYKLESYKNLTFDDINNFYVKSLKGKPIVICLVGDKKSVDMTKLAAFGKIVELKESILFNK
jgi:zinc protease